MSRKNQKNPFPIILLIVFGIAFMGMLKFNDNNFRGILVQLNLVEALSGQETAQNTILEVQKDIKLNKADAYRHIWERKPKTTTDIIKQVAKEKGFKNVDLLIKIARCESGLRTDIRGFVDKRDRGLFMINSRWNPDVPDYIAFNAKASTKWAIDEINKGNIWKWDASKFCWNK